MNSKNLYLTVACVCSTLALSLSGSSSSLASLSSSSATTTARRSFSMAPQNTLGGVGVNNQALDKIIDRIVEKVTPQFKVLKDELKSTGQEITAELKKEFKATAIEVLAEAKKTGNEVCVRGGEIWLSSGKRLLFVCVVVGLVVYIFVQKPYLAASLVTIFLSAPAMYLQSKGELKPLARDLIEAYGNTTRLQHTLETTTQTLSDTNRVLAETRATLDITRAALTEATAKLAAASAKSNTSRQ